MSDKKKSPFWTAVQEIGWEVLLTVVCFGIGALILWACGMDLETIMENDWVVVLGCGVFLVLFVAVYALVSFIKSRKRNKEDK
jgi:uncharacterized membrane protein